MKWAIREAVDVYFKAKSIFKLGARTIRAGEPVLIFDTVKTSTLEVAAAISYVTGGRGNSRILSYEGDKTLSFQFEDALLSNEGLAILSGADLIPARNKRLPGSSPEARSVISHFTEKYAVITNNQADISSTNSYPNDPSIGATGAKPRGGDLNVWLTRRPYVGQNASIYVMLLDQAGEMSGSPLEINLAVNGGDENLSNKAYLAKFSGTANTFVAFGKNGAPMSVKDYETPKGSTSEIESLNGVFDDQVLHYVDVISAAKYWVSSWGDAPATYDPATKKWTELNPWDDTTTPRPNPDDHKGENEYIRKIQSVEDKDGKDVYSYAWDLAYAYLLAPSGGIAQPKAFKEGTQFVYKINVPSILYQDIVLVDYYVEYTHNATQVSILPDKFGPYMYVEGSSLVRRASDGTDLPVEFVIPKFKVTTALTFTLQSTGDPSTFTFQGDAYPDFSKFDLTRKVLADIQILDADDNYDGASGWGGAPSDPTDYRRFHYNDNDGEYLWKDPSMQPHQNINYADTLDYIPEDGGPATVTPGLGIIKDSNPDPTKV